MKKNRMLRLAYSLLVAVVLSTCVISGTFAKYVTNATAEDSARVAKFGVTVTGTGDMFKTEYESDDADFEDSTVLSSETDVKVVAPGTSGKLGGFTLSGTPEVAVRVSYEADVDLGDKWVVDGEYYCPLKVTVNGVELNGNDYDSIELFEAAIEAAINSYSKDYAPGTVLSSKNDVDDVDGDDLDISWSWTFEAEDNAKDTLLGDQAAADNAATISVNVTCTVTQID